MLAPPSSFAQRARKAPWTPPPISSTAEQVAAWGLQQMSGRSNQHLGTRSFGLRLAVCIALAALAPSTQGAAGAIEGTIRVAPGLAGQIAAGDRLVIKLFHPGAGAELDAQYRTIDKFSLPLEFTLTPSTDMSGQPKFTDYVVEVFTDRDGDPLKVAPGELGARTPGPVPLGTTGLVLELKPRRE